jgi:hypothetical protein
MMELVAVLLSSVAAAAAGEPSAAPVAQRFGWISGCWGGARGASSFREIWTIAAPDLMLGMSVTTEPSKPAQFEYLRIETRDGRAVYVAQPGGVPPTPFEWQADASTGEAAVFANPQHDFPKRVGYRRVEPNGVLAWIDGGESGEGRVEYPMRRTSCPAAP